MLLLSWVTWAVRPCCLNFKCSQPDSPFLYIGGGEVFQRPVTNLNTCPWIAYRKKGISLQNPSHTYCGSICNIFYDSMILSTASWLLLTLFHICLAPLCLAAAAPALCGELCRQVLLFSAAPLGPQDGQCPVPPTPACIQPMDGSPGAVLAEAGGFGLGELCYIFSCHWLGV